MNQNRTKEIWLYILVPIILILGAYVIYLRTVPNTETSNLATENTKQLSDRSLKISNYIDTTLSVKDKTDLYASANTFVKNNSAPGIAFNLIPTDMGKDWFKFDVVPKSTDMDTAQLYVQKINGLWSGVAFGTAFPDLEKTHPEFFKPTNPDQSGQVSTQTNTLSGANNPVPANTSEDNSIAAGQFSGYIKSVYSKNGKKYIEIDYIQYRHEEGDMPWGTIVNNNPKIRTIEVAGDAKIKLTNDYVAGVFTSGDYTVDFNKLIIIFASEKYKIQALNPWGITIKNGTITEIKEEFRS